MEATGTSREIFCLSFSIPISVSFVERLRSWKSWNTGPTIAHFRSIPGERYAKPILCGASGGSTLMQ